MLEPVPTPHGSTAKPPINHFGDWTPQPGSDAGSITGSDGGWQAPDATKVDPAGTGQLQVNSAALRAFADRMDDFATLVDSGRSVLDGVAVPAGAFPSAYLLRTNVMGDGSSTAAASFSTGVVPVVPGTRGFLDAAHEALYKLQGDCRQMAAIFEGTESLNAQQSQQLETLLQNTGQDLSQATGSPMTGASPTTSSGTSGTTTS